MSNQNKMMVLIIKGAISDLPEEDKAATSEAYQKMKDVVDQYGDSGKLALALLGAELGAEE